MSTLPILVCVEGLAGKQFVEGLLRPYLVEVVESSTSSGAIADAEYTLLAYPGRPVVVLLGADTENEREAAQRRATIKRILARDAPEGWYVGMAVPRLDAWARTDSRIQRDFDTYQGGKANYRDLAARFVELMKDQPFDASELLRSNADFRGLIEFLQKHAPAAPAAAVRAASS